MRLATFSKQPIEYKDYDVDFTPWLADGDTLNTVDVGVSCMSNPQDTTLYALVQYTTNIVKVWVGGGTSGEKYKIELTAHTVGGRVDQSELIFKVKEI